MSQQENSGTVSGTGLHNTAALPVSVLRRMACCAYDWFAVVAIAIVGWFPVLMLLQNVLPLYESAEPWNLIYLFLVSFGYFSYCWRRGGQTLGMQSWKVQLNNPGGRRFSWRQCLLRYGGGLVSLLLAGLGFWWAWTNPQRRTWHDSWSGSTLEFKPVKKK